MSEPNTIEEINAKIAELKKEKELQAAREELAKLEAVKNVNPKVEPININEKTLQDQTITKKVAAIEVNKELSQDKIFYLVGIVGTLIVFGLTNMNTMLGGASAVLLVAALAYRLALVQKRMNYFKLTYGI